MTNPYPRYIQDNDFPWREYENPLHIAWEQGYTAHKEEAEEDALEEIRGRGVLMSIPWWTPPDRAGGG